MRIGETFQKIIMAALCVVLLGTGLGIAYAKEDYSKPYPTCGVVVEVDYDEDTVVFEDCNGNLWAFYGTEDWIEGDIVAAIMSDSETPEIYDDEILTVRYCGHLS